MIKKIQNYKLIKGIKFFFVKLIKFNNNRNNYIIFIFLNSKFQRQPSLSDTQYIFSHP